MKKISPKLVLLLCLTCFLQFSCKKDDPAPLEDNTSALLQNKNWKLTTGTVSPALGGITDWLNNYWDECDRDDLYRFNSPDAFVLDAGLTVCTPGDPQSQAGTWTYNGNSKVLHFALNSPSDNYDLTITQISTNSFTGKMDEVISGVTYTSTWTFTKQ